MSSFAQIEYMKVHGNSAFYIIVRRIKICFRHSTSRDSNFIRDQVTIYKIRKGERELQIILCLLLPQR